MDNDDFAPCWNCEKMNKKQICGYYMCDCRSFKESSVVWYLPMEVYNWRRGIRNNDTWLILQTLRKLGFKVYIDYHEIKDMPSFESITRSRRYWQNTMNKFLPSERVGEARDKAVEDYKEEFR